MKLILLAFISSIIFAGEYAVVSNKLVNDLTVTQIRAIFLKKLKRLNDVNIVSVNLLAKSKIRKSFEENILHMKTRRLKEYWIKQHYLGNRPPLVMKSTKSALLFIKKVDAGITYAKLEDISIDVKILYKWKD